MIAFETLPGDPRSSVILHVPHSSTHIPEDVRRGIVLTDDELAAELAAITDADTDRIAEGAADRASMRPWIFLNRTSRLVIDPERFPDEREELNEVGMGAVYVRTTGGEVLRTPTQAERDALIAAYFTPYAESIAGLVRERLAACGRVTIIDVHSYPVAKLPYELHGDGPRPEVCIGTDAYHTPPELEGSAITAFATAAPSSEIGVNTPFIGCYVPLDQYEEDPAVRAVMLEIRRDVVEGHAEALVTGTAALIDSQAVEGTAQR